MGLEDSKDLSTCGDERVIRSVDRVYDRYVTMEGSQGSDTLSETWSELLGIYPLENLVDGDMWGKSVTRTIEIFVQETLTIRFQTKQGLLVLKRGTESVY